MDPLLNDDFLLKGLKLLVSIQYMKRIVYCEVGTGIWKYIWVSGSKGFVTWRQKSRS